MKRRTFLKLPIAATALTLVAPDAGIKAAIQDRIDKGFRVGAQKDRRGEELLIMGGRFDLKVSGRDTGGELCVYDTT